MGVPVQNNIDLPWGVVWDHYCATAGVPGGGRWLDEVRAYERIVISARV